MKKKIIIVIGVALAAMIAIIAVKFGFLVKSMATRRLKNGAGSLLTA